MQINEKNQKQIQKDRKHTTLTTTIKIEKQTTLRNFIKGKITKI